MTIKHFSLAEQVYHKLLEEIIHGTRKGGDKLSEENICGELGVSRTPAREALMRLCSDGLVERIPRRGCFVKEFNTEDITDLYECRKMVECLALDAGFDLIPRDELKQLEQMIAGEMSEEKTSSLNVDERMHDLIISSCPNLHLKEITRQLVKRTRPYRSWRTYGSGDVREISEERRNIILAILGNDRKKAVQLLGKHILQGLEVIAGKNDGKRMNSEF